MKPGVYDVIMLDEFDNLIVKDLSDYRNREEFSGFSKMGTDGRENDKNYILKCNLCNYTFLDLESLLDHVMQAEH